VFFPLNRNVFITHPTEIAVLGSMSPAEIEDFAIDHGWRVVSRLGGRQIEFYNDASARLDDCLVRRRNFLR
jgi:hypothetical protein